MERIAPLLAPGAEVSVEANPETVEPALLASLRAAGVTRLSLGVQSFQPHLLAALEPRRWARRSRAAFAMRGRLAFESLSVDLLFGVPGQSADDLEDDIAEVLALGPDHVSWYELELKPGSALAAGGDRPRRGVRRRTPTSAWSRRSRTPATAGTRPRTSPARGTSAATASATAGPRLHRPGGGRREHVRGRRWRNAPGWAATCGPPRRRRPAANARAAGPRHPQRERWMLSLRLDRPLALAEAGPPDHPEALGRLRTLGLLEPGPDGLVTLSRRGRFLQNAVLHELMEYA